MLITGERKEAIGSEKQHSIKPQKTNSFDPRFESYIRVYNNLDNLQWQIPGFLVAVSAIIFGFFGNLLLTNPRVEIGQLIPNLVVGVMFVFCGIL